jgi:hypothetical protein
MSGRIKKNLRFRQSQIELNKRSTQTINNQQQKDVDYLIVADTKCTEKNYIDGIKQDISREYSGNIIIERFTKSHGVKLIERIRKHKNDINFSGVVWCVFDRDKITDFNEAIAYAEKCGFESGWSNPCIEIWFSTYFGGGINCSNSKTCEEKFKRLFKTKTKNVYDKNDDGIYKKLLSYGDEKAAIELAKQWEQTNINRTASDCIPGTRLHILVSELKKIN